jgi:PAS domain S-box-containing protein
MNWKSFGRALRWLGPISVLLAGLWLPVPVRAQSGFAVPSPQRKTSTPYTGDLSIFDVPGRDERLQINRVMDMLGIEPGKNVADIGAGSGWFTVRAARRVTGSGTVYAVDINPEAIQYIDRRAKREQLQNIKTILSKPDDPQVPVGSIDAVLLLKTYHEVAHPVVLLRNLRSSLKPGAKIGIIDRNGNGADHGVSKDLCEGQRLSHTGSWARSVSTGDVFFSRESYRIFGLDPATRVTLETILSRVHPDDRPSIAETIQKAIRDASDFESDYRIILEDGTIRHIHVLGHPAKNAAGNVVEFVGTHMDMTEQHRSRKALEDALVEINTLKEQLFQENVALRQEIDETSMFDEIVGKSSALQKVLKELETVGPTDSTVLIYGETGTGKELIARAIHNLSSRRSNAFVKVNCAAIPTGLLESELFGHEKGAFTGAISQRIGRFELAHQGTVFLDEIGEVPLELQPKLLRVLQEREFERLGSSRTQHSGARLIAATNRDLSAMVEEQKFRADLFYRLNVFPLYVPALRERPEDVPLLVRHFAELFSRRMSKVIQTIPPETMSALMRYHWPGNVRELQNVIERAVILSTRGAARADCGAECKGECSTEN